MYIILIISLCASVICQDADEIQHKACVQFQEMVCPKPEEFVSSPLSEVGEDSEEGQFPYMALLGFGDNSSTASWLCGGSVISNKYILTAAHCTHSTGPSVGPVNFAVVGTLRHSDPIKEGRLYKVKKIIKHPEYRPPHRYNDIALLEMEAPITFDDLVQPACLHGELEQEDEVAYVAGWDTTNKGAGADVLQNAKIYKFKDEECAKLYPPSRRLRQGFNSTTQLCYGHHQMPTATCQGDSGNPMITFNSHFSCLRKVVGVTSFGKSCGHTGEPGIYTRVSAFLPWIGSVVWP